jgi:gliding motility-associated-like protein
MRKIIFTLGFFVIACTSFANHTKGGYMYYEYLGPGIANPAYNRYKVTLKVYMSCQATGNQINDPINITYFNLDNSSIFANRSVALASIISISNCTLPSCYPCFSSIPSVCYKIVTYIDNNVELPTNAQGYTVSYSRCCRIIGIVNLQSPSNNLGATWKIDIPGQAIGNNADKNNSAVFSAKDTVIVCKNNYFTYDFSATDVDGDLLKYSFCDALNGGSQADPAPTQSVPPFNFVPYAFGYTGSFPLGNNVTINQNTGVISGFAPATPGTYVITVCVDEIRNGIVIATSRKEIHMDVGDCDVANAELQPDYTTCDGFTINFQNLSNSALNNSYYWDFGVPGITTDTSNLQFPTYTYPDTGHYNVKLVVNRGQSCPDSAFMNIGIYPGFIPNFTFTGACYTSPIQFNDATTTVYGVVNSWSWNFGDLTVLSDTSHVKNPSYTYPASGIKNVELIVTNSKGCIDTITKPVPLIDKPTITLPFKDTLICSIDTLMLQSSFSSGNPNWTPNYNIINPGSFTPLVYPKFTTTYVVTANDQGCIQKDSIIVNVKDFVTVDVMPDTSICLTDAFRIETNSDALSYIWTPAATLNNNTIQDPIATPVSSPTKYIVKANIGKCQSSDSITVIANPYPQVYAGLDTALCYGDQVQLHGTITGTVFQWSPQNGLINANTLDPIAKPIKTTLYVLSATNVTGCTKPAKDSVLVVVIPPIRAFAGNDTTVVIGQPLQLFASGSTNYLWSPTTFLSNPSIQNPIANLPNSMTYIVKVSNPNNCFAYDTINITVFKTAPDIFVPTVFSPNGDGKNDRLIPVPVGLKGYDFFEIYNRWGQRMFRTTQIGVGWDGYFRGVLQDVDTYVWQVQGTDFTGKRIYKKGTLVLVK